MYVCKEEFLILYFICARQVALFFKSRNFIEGKKKVTDGMTSWEWQGFLWNQLDFSLASNHVQITSREQLVECDLNYDLRFQRK